MGTLKHPLVEDRVILVRDSQRAMVKGISKQPLAALDLELFRSKE